MPQAETISVYCGGERCEVFVHSSGLPQLVSLRSEMPVLRKVEDM